ncbi:dihydrofolate reductase [Thermolongibacillus altinsuensis]
MISIIVAMDRQRLIGKNNALPWHLPADLAYFKQVTMGHAIVMGRKTFESIGRALPGRKNIVLTRKKDFQCEQCTVIHSIDDIKKIEEEEKEEIFIIGGAQLFQETLPFADRLYITYIDAVFEGDTFFPPFNEDEWRLISRKKGIQDEKNPYRYEFHVYERKTR